MVGKYLTENEEGIMAFNVINNERSVWFSTEVHDKLNTLNNTNNFIEYLATEFQNKFHRNASVWHEDYEFKISIPNNGDRILDDIEELMNDALEDWWSVQWEELEYNNIQVKRESVLVSFRVHDVHEVQFRYNDGGK
jgi:hypothetical protein